MVGKLEPVQSKVYPNIWWDFTEVANELERVRQEHAPNVRHDEREPFDWVVHAPSFTLGLEELREANGNDKPLGYYLITRAFKACGVTTDKEIAKLSGYAPSSSSSVGRWDEHNQTPTVQRYIFPALCDAYCTVRKERPHPFSSTYSISDARYLNGITIPKDKENAERMMRYINQKRKGIESEALWLLLYGVLDAHPYMSDDIYTLERDGYRRAIALYATLLLSGSKLGDLAHVASALVAQHIATEGNLDLSEFDSLCLSSERGKLDFEADRSDPTKYAYDPLDTLVVAKRLGAKRESISRASLRYVTTEFLQLIERVIHDELERRSKIGHPYMPWRDAETEPTDEDEPST